MLNPYARGKGFFRKSQRKNIGFHEKSQGKFVLLFLEIRGIVVKKFV